MLSSKVFYNYHYNILNHHDHHRLTRDASCCTTAHLLLLHRPLPHSHAGNSTDVPSVCRLLPSLLNKPHLTTLDLDHEPSSCVVDSAWAQAGLPVPPPEVVSQGWTAVLQFLRAGPTVPVHELRLMLIGDGEAGKTSLQQALKAPSHRAHRIGKEQRTVGIDISELQFACADAPTVKCQVCDFAGLSLIHI